MILWAHSKVNRAKQPSLEVRGGCCCGRHPAHPRCSWVFGQSTAKAQHISPALVLGRGASQCLLFAAQFKQLGALSDYGLFWFACISHFWLKDFMHWSVSERGSSSLYLPANQVSVLDHSFPFPIPGSVQGYVV